MSKGYLVFAQNSETDYVRQAIALAASLKNSGNNQPISIVTDDTIPAEYVPLFDKVIPIPWGDDAVRSQWKIENRWKLYHLTPYEETVVLDSDVLVTATLDNLWKFVDTFEVYFTSVVADFKSRPVVDLTYRQTFIQNDLPNLYSGLYYFKKSEFAREFFETLELVVKNYQEVYKLYTPNKKQEFLSIDVSAAIAAKILDVANDITCDAYCPTTFYHLKPKLQSLPVNVLRWTDALDVEYSDKLIIGNHIAHGVIHYVEDQFLTNEMFNRIVDNANV